MAVIRVEKTQNYTVMSNHHFKEKEMSLKAKGLLSLMLSLPNDWDYSINGLVAICKENETSIKSALNELKDFKYLKINKLMPNVTQSGRIEYEYIVYEHPFEKQALEKQGIENLGVEFLVVENQGQLNTKELNTNKSNTNKLNKEYKESKKETYNDILVDFNDELKDAYLEFISMRKFIKKPLTNRALKMLITKVNILSDHEETQIAILNQSILNSWQDVYPLKSNNQYKVVIHNQEEERAF